MRTLRFLLALLEVALSPAILLLVYGAAWGNANLSRMLSFRDAAAARGPAGLDFSRALG